MDNTALSIEVSSELDDRQAYIVRALAFGSTRSAAVGAAGVGRRTFYHWLENNPVFEDAVHRAESIAEVGYTQVTAKAAQEGDWRAALAWLKRRRQSGVLFVRNKEGYSRRYNPERTGLRQCTRTLRFGNNCQQ